MALNGINPIIIFRIYSAGLTDQEEQELAGLKAGAATPAAGGIFDAQIAALEKKKKTAHDVSEIPIPIILDSHLTQTYITNNGISVNKTYTFYDDAQSAGSDMTQTVNNDLRVNIEVAKNSKLYNIIINACIAISQLYFNKSDIYPNVSFYSMDTILQKGFLKGFSRQQIKGTTKDVITLTIANQGREVDSTDSKTELSGITPVPEYTGVL